LPEDKNRVNKLKRKLKEYAERVEKVKKELEKDNPTWHPELVQLTLEKSQNYIRLSVLSELFLEEEVDTYKFSLELNKELNGFDTKEYSITCAVINDYCETGGKNTSGGTGLK